MTLPSTNVTPTGTKAHATIALMCCAACRVSGWAGRNRPSTARLKHCSTSTMPPAIAMLSAMPVRAIRPTRSSRRAPRFCAAMGVTAMPIASTGSWM